MSLSKISLAALLFGAASARTKDTATPLMGWNSYNQYNCQPSESAIKESAQGLLDTGLAGVGYKSVTVDCGWNRPGRDSQNRLQWDLSRFPSGGKAIGDFIHGLGLQFGAYSGAGYFQCGSTDLPASLGFESIDAKSFVEWGADSLKYDNCYGTSRTEMVDYTSAESGSPNRFATMARALNETSRDVIYQICQWGVGENIGNWAPPLGNSWRISNDIINSWPSIYRITNQVVPLADHSGPGAFADMDMLIVGLGALNLDEERFHFAMWAINKSPLIIGCRVASSTNQQSIQVLSNKEVIAINQDPLAKSASLIRRYTEAEWDLWSGPLSGNRVVVALANWKGSAQSISVNLRETLGIESATARDVWAARDLGSISGTHTASVPRHGIQLLVLSNVVRSSYAPKAGAYYRANNAQLAGTARVVSCGSGTCLPTGNKVGSIGPNPGDASATFSSVTTTSAGRKLLGIDFINYEVALESAWSTGSSSRNMTISVNGGRAVRWAFPISGQNWSDTGRLLVEIDGFTNGSNNRVAFAGSGGNWAPDLVGFQLFEY